MDRAVRRRDGRFYTPAPLAAAVVRRALSPLIEGRDAEQILELRILDPACGEGVFLHEVLRLLRERGAPEAEIARRCLVGVDRDEEALERARTRFDTAQPDLRRADALRVDWGDERFDAVIGNPPWVSFSGRHAQPLGPSERADLASRFETFRGWPNLHGLFLELAVRLSRSRIGLLLPAQVGDLEGYGAVRALLRRRGRVETPLVDFGEQAFAGVVQPCCGLFWEADAAGTAGGPAAFALREPPEVLARLADLARAPAESFADIGVHTGNCAGRLLGDAGLPLREGRDVHPYRLDPPRRRVRTGLDLAPGEYFRIGDPERMRDIPILLRQTARRPIAALHRPAGCFRNSVLACRGIPGLPDEVAVAWLNSTVVGLVHRWTVREAGQRSFPQLKLRHLRDLPLPAVADLPARTASLARQVACEGRLDLARALDAEITRWFGLDPEGLVRLRADLPG